MAPVEDQPEDVLDSSLVDLNTFNQILEMDEPDDHEFSTSIVFGFFDQAEETFAAMDTALAEKNLEELSSLGHFLKGSSATIGLTKVRDGCEHIQRYGKLENIDGSSEPDEDLCLERLTKAIQTVKEDYKEVETVLRKFYEQFDS
ncbi:unnamed protein product [Clonostachys rosea f. rosea IK726]|uniref:HPt domain-containing protein n=2 Tax=Bionectria ochroleuca TaxID=29856 RepID=A0A0B7K103_BIOOC|nr:unnamed protein product [Clonostachys rosea f. rosea IK726]